MKLFRSDICLDDEKKEAIRAEIHGLIYIYIYINI